MAKRTWGDVMREMIALRTGANAARYERSAAESAFDAIRDRRLIDTQAEQYGLSLSAAFSGSTLVPLFSGLLAAGVLAGLLPAMRCYRRSLSDGLSPEVES